jgi:hypothetical protein
MVTPAIAETARNSRRERVGPDMKGELSLLSAIALRLLFFDFIGGASMVVCFAYL